MAVNIRNVMELLQQKIAGADSSDSIDDLTLLFKAAKKAGGSFVRAVDDDGQLPDAATTTNRLYFSKLVGGLRFNNNDNWDYISSGSEVNVGTYNIGSNYGFTAGGYVGTTPMEKTIDKFPFPSDANATDVGDLAHARRWAASVSSSTDGYLTSGVLDPPATPWTGWIDKYPFTVGWIGGSQIVADITLAGTSGTVGNTYSTAGYFSGGHQTNLHVEKFIFSTEDNTSLVDDLLWPTLSGMGFSSSASGYILGAYYNPTTPISPEEGYNIQKVQFNSDTTSLVGYFGTSISIFPSLGVRAGGLNSYENGYAAGANIDGLGTIGTIYKWPFATETTTSFVGSLISATVQYQSSQNSTAHGYASGGAVTSPTFAATNTIQKFPFTSDANATDVANLTVSRGYAAGNQY